MSVTTPTLKFDPLDEVPPLEAVDVVLLLLLGAAALPPALEVLLLLLLPHAASPRVSTAIANAAAPDGLILPVTTTPFHQNRMRNHNPCAGRSGSRLTWSSLMTTIVRALVAHTPANPFVDAGALAAFYDGAVAVSSGRIAGLGNWAEVRADFADAEVVDARGAVLLPGFVDCHVHFPQIGVIGALGLELLDWLQTRALPQEARLGDEAYATAVADQFVRGLAANGTTTALVFGSHFAGAQEALFRAASAVRLRVISGLVVSDRGLLPSLLVSPDRAFESSRGLIERWHGRGLLRYAVSPRFSVSCSEELLSVCGELGREAPGVMVTSHLNESVGEISLVGDLFPWARDYLETYERHGLVGSGSVFAHDVHVTDSELGRLAAAGASVAHCPSSNAFLGSGMFPLRRHVERGVRVALGTDVGAGTGLSMLKEGLVAYQMQMLRPDGVRLGPAHLLWLSTSAGASALGLSEEIGDLSVGKSADFVLVRPVAGSTLAAVLERSESIEATLGALFTLAREESIAEVRVAGEIVWAAPSGVGVVG
jgi:guanine deaminase